MKHEKLEDLEEGDLQEGKGPAPQNTVALIAIFVLSATSFANYSMVLPGLWAYVDSLGGSKPFYGLCAAAFSLARVVALPLLGAWGDSAKFQIVFQVSLLIGSVGNALYSIAQWQESLTLILLGRIIVGIGAANTSPILSYLTRVTSEEERTKYLSIWNGCNFVALVAGPIFNLIVLKFDFMIGPLRVDQFTGPGYLSIVINIICSIFCQIAVPEPPALEEEAVKKGVSRWKQLKVYVLNRHAWVPCFIGFCNQFDICMLETIVAPVAKQSLSWDLMRVSLFFCLLCTLGAFSMVVSAVLAKRVKDRSFLVFGGAMLSITLGLSFYSWRHTLVPEWAFFACGGFLVMSIPLQNSPASSLYSKMLGAKNMGFFFGLQQVINGFGRVAGPAWGGIALALPHGHMFLFAAVTLLLAVTAILIAVYWAEMDPTSKEWKEGKALLSPLNNEPPSTYGASEQ